MALVLFFHLLAVLTLVAGKPILLPRQDQGATQAVASPSFDVMIESLGNTTVKAHVKNLGSDAYRLVQRGDILDHVPTKKVNIAGGDEEPTFTGVRVEYIVSHLTSDGFVQIEPNQSVASIFDVADIYALSPGQEYTAVAKGTLEYTTLDNEKEFLTFPYTSNNISFTAPNDVTNRLEDRSMLQCSDQYNSIVQEAITRAAKMATAGAEDARSGQASALFQKFFKSTSQDDLDTVAGRLEAIAKEAISTGQLTYYCEPTSKDYCTANIAAMMYPSQNRIVNCPAYESYPNTTDRCGHLDKGGVTLHEYAHATALYAPGTDDIAYGMESVLELDTADSLNNADSFAYYASAVFLQCAADDSVEIGTEMNINLGVDSGDDTSNTDTTTETPTQTPTATQEPTYTPEPDPTDDGGTGTGTGSSSGSDSGTGTGTSWSTTSPDSSTTTTVSTSTSSDGSTWSVQDFINWIMSVFGNNDSGSSSGQTQGQTNTSANGESMAGVEGSNCGSDADANANANANTNTVSNPGCSIVTVVVNETATAPTAAQATAPPLEAEEVEGEEDCDEE
ncbi:Deuterolysin metalloprotease family-domain-containing protein [Aspergillus oleicola]